MNLLVMLVGCLLGLVAASLMESASKKENRQTPRPSRREPRPLRSSFLLLNNHQKLERRRQTIRRLQELAVLRRLAGPVRTRDMRTSSFVKRWRKGIVELVRLAYRNLLNAEDHLEMKRYKQAIDAASTSLENIARALIHCYGGKPDPNPGQEEALRMLSWRFKGEERVEFERAVQDVAHINHNRIILKHVSQHGARDSLLEETKAKQILECASREVDLFKRVLTKNFATEIPELDEIGQKESSSDASVRIS